MIAMRKIIISILALSVLAMTCSCSKNEAPKFDDSIAFVSFSASDAKIDETLVDASGSFTATGDTVSLLVTVASLNGIRASVPFEIVADTTFARDGSYYVPKEGVNFKILGDERVLEFDEANRTREIKVVGLYYDQYTDDLSVNLILKPGSEFKVKGQQNACKVTIRDMDHPLSSILGTYTVSGYNMYQELDTWTLTIFKDDDDPTKCWLSNLARIPSYYGIEYEIRELDLYATVNEDLTKILVPMGQFTKFIVPSASAIYFVGVDSAYEMYSTGSFTLTIVKESGKVKSLEFDPLFGMGFVCYIGGIIDDEHGVPLDLFMPGTVAVKD